MIKKNIFSLSFLLLILLSTFFYSCGSHFEVDIDSEPRGAEVFLLPLIDSDNDTTILNNYNKLKKYQVIEGNTPQKIKLFGEINYLAIFKLNGKTETRLLEIHWGQDYYSIKVIF